ncbi:unnamed protein product [Caenorhabditis auriculariae]|uniref:ShKT domain-containing protein n=1 Tax=Caenorhabditis auriculariae TaxID=2777116 RepID=A0A8S1GU60_9PELO|nr:unnamed protein product [Caenorhabditis auriculariae]
MVLLIFLMFHQIPETNSSDYCKDLSPDCVQLASWCRSTDQIEQKLMKMSCRATCNACQSPVGLRPSTIEDLKATGILEELVDLLQSKEENMLTTCVDQASDCQSKAELCHHKTYAKLVMKLCAKTCNLCSVGKSGGNAAECNSSH